MRVGAILLCSCVVACTEDMVPGVRTGVSLDVHYDSSLPVADLMIVLSGPAGKETRQTLEPPLFIEPPGVRTANFEIDVGPELGTEVLVHVDGRARMTTVVGSGETEVRLESGRLVPAKVSLGRANPCGAGGCPRCGNMRVEGTEQCDDGNSDDTDECKADCTPTIPITWTYETESFAPVVTTSPTFVPIPGANLTFTPANTSERWLIFLSGRMTSTSEAQVAPEVGLAINGVMRDSFGHQIFGGGDGWAGFVTFELVENATTAVSIEPLFRAVAGETRVADLRVVAARVPESAELQVISTDASREVTGLDVEIQKLTVTPSRPGSYLILAKMSLSEAPGADTAQGWLLDETKARFPEGPAGVGFANGREPLLPMWVALQRDLTGPADFSLIGSTSATEPTGWWDERWMRRTPVELTSDVELVAGTQISLPLNHADLVTRGLSRADGADLRVVYLGDGNTTEIDRVLDLDSGWNRSDTRIWFKTQDTLPAGGVIHYHLYYARTDAGPAPEDGQEVFEFYDDFSGNVLDPQRWTVVSGTPQLAGGSLELAEGASLTTNYQLPDNSLIEVRGTVRSTADVNRAIYLGAGDPAGTFQMLQHGFLMADGTHYVVANTTQTAYTPADPDLSQRYRITRTEGAVRLIQNGTEHSRVALPAPVAGLNVGMANEASAELEYEWIRARKAPPRAPAITLHPENGLAGTAPSSFSGARILALRLDAFPGVHLDFDPALVTTNETAPTVMSAIDVPAPPRDADHLVFQTLRVAGESDVTGRKAGVISADGQLLLETSHRINRDGTALSGYHHVAGVVDVRHTGAAVRYENAVRSPDGIDVTGASSSIIVLRYPR